MTMTQMQNARPRIGGVLAPGAVSSGNAGYVKYGHSGNDTYAVRNPEHQGGIFGDIGRGVRDVFGRLVKFSSSPYGVGLAASFSRGDPVGEAALNATQYAQQMQQQEYLRKLQEDQFKRQQTSDFYNNSLKAAQLKRMNAPAPRNIIKGADGFQYYQDDGSRVLPNVETIPKAPKMETLYGDNGREYKGRWNPNTQSFDRIGGFKAANNSITPSQTSGNKEIQDARDYIANIKVPEGSTLIEEVIRRTQKASNTGRTNKDYSPLLARYLSKATKRMVGEDGGYSGFMQGLMGTQSLDSSFAQIIAEAKTAIEQGAPRDKVLERLKTMGVDTTGL